jgi:ribosomal protein L37AE/L43A
MTFDAIPEDRDQFHPCPNCEHGTVAVDGKTWDCDTCDFSSATIKESSIVAQPVVKDSLVTDVLVDKTDWSAA